MSTNLMVLYGAVGICLYFGCSLRRGAPEQPRLSREWVVGTLLLVLASTMALGAICGGMLAIRDAIESMPR